MRKIKRIIALVTVAMFLLSLAAPAALAATKEEAFGRLNALSVAVGDQTGNPQYDKNFTRAEAAAIMVNLSGMNAAINSAKGTTKFKDVPASHWASGVVNLAVGAGVIKGYPDGTFKPDVNVSYAELSAMLVGVLGYGPKLQGTWPSNVVGKAAQLGLLDGITVADVNGVAVRSNVFLAADKALTVKPLIETKNGFEEDTKTLMETKLTVTKKAKGTVTITPSYGGADKQKLNIQYPTTPAVTNELVTLVDSLNPDDYMGLEVEAWVKDDKAFFLNVKTDASNIINDTLIYGINGATNGTVINDGGVDGNGTIVDHANVTDLQIDTGDKKYAAQGVASPTIPATQYYNNFAVASNANPLTSQTPVRIIMGSNGKATYVFGLKFKSAIVDSVSTADEKINLDSDTVWAGQTATITVKDEFYKIFRNGKAATLADLKKGDEVDYIDVTNGTKLIYANDAAKTVKISSIVDDGTWKAKDGAVNAGTTLNKFKFNVADGALKSDKYVMYSTNDGDTYTTASTTADFSSVVNKDVKVKLNKDGKVSYIIAASSSAAGSSEVEALVENIKVVDSTTKARYLYVAKFDGTETYYEVTKDTKIDGNKISEYALKQTDGSAAVPADLNYSNAGPGARSEAGPHIANINLSNEVKIGDVIKFTLASDNTIDNIVRETTVTPGTGNLETGTDYTVSKDNNTFKAGAGTTLLVDANSKFLWVKSQAVAGTGNAAGIFDAQLHAAQVIDDVDSASWSSVKSIDRQELATNVAVVKDAGKAKYVVIYKTTAPVASSDMFGLVLEKGKTASNDDYLKIAHDDKTTGEVLIGSANTGVAKAELVKFTLKADPTRLNTNTLQNPVTLGAYTYFKVDSVSGNQIKVKGSSDDAGTAIDTAVQYLIVNDKTKYWNVDDSPYSAKTINDLGGKIIKVYDTVRADGTTGTDSSYDFVVVTKN